MSKHHTKRTQSNNRTDTSTSISPEAPSSSFEDMFSPAYEEVQKRAYQIHEEKGGNDLDNWLEAERILKEEHDKS